MACLDILVKRETTA